MDWESLLLALYNLRQVALHLLLEISSLSLRTTVSKSTAIVEEIQDWIVKLIPQSPPGSPPSMIDCQVGGFL